MNIINERLQAGPSGLPDCTWMVVGSDTPAGQILGWTDGQAVVGSLLVERRADGTVSRSFMDVLGNEILPWPSHWMRVPQPPET
jgi:hypothetical protein